MVHTASCTLVGLKRRQPYGNNSSMQRPASWPICCTVHGGTWVRLPIHPLHTVGFPRLFAMLVCACHCMKPLCKLLSATAATTTGRDSRSSHTTYFSGGTARNKRPCSQPTILCDISSIRGLQMDCYGRESCPEQTDRTQHFNRPTVGYLGC